MPIPDAALSRLGPALSRAPADYEETIDRLAADLDNLRRSVSIITEQATNGTTITSPTAHSDLTGLDYGSSGHTGFVADSSFKGHINGANHNQTRIVTDMWYRSAMTGSAGLKLCGALTPDSVVGYRVQRPGHISQIHGLFWNGIVTTPGIIKLIPVVNGSIRSPMSVSTNVTGSGDFVVAETINTPEDMVAGDSFYMTALYDTFAGTVNCMGWYEITYDTET